MGGLLWIVFFSALGSSFQEMSLLLSKYTHVWTEPKLESQQKVNITGSLGIVSKVVEFHSEMATAKLIILKKKNGKFFMSKFHCG